MPDSAETRQVVCFGEVIWDQLPDARFPGGAPMNVAYHLTKLGCTGILASCVGADALGAELLEHMRRHGLDLRFVTEDPGLPTGIVEVSLESGSPSYTIVENVAWDKIVVTDKLARVATRAEAIVFGSLAMRTSFNQSSLASLLGGAPHALKAFDVNLRPPFDDHRLIWSLASRANLIKLNDDEIARLLDTEAAGIDLESSARSLAHRADCEIVCVTAGAQGAGLLHNGIWHWVDSQPIVVADTIGAGDAFFAALVAGLIQRDKSPLNVLSHASQLAGFVASQSGATPGYALNSDGQPTII